MGLFARIDGTRPPSVSLVDIDTTAQDGSGSHTHPVSFGASNNARHLIAVIGYDDGTGGSITSCSIGGVTATRAVTVSVGSSGGRTISEIWIAKVPSGTSGNVTISGPSGNWGSMCAVYAALNLRSAAASDTGSDTILPVAFNIDVPARGIVIATSVNGAGGDVGTGSWSGITRDFTQKYFSNVSGLSGASGTVTSEATLSLTANWSGGGTAVGCAASFR